VACSSKLTPDTAAGRLLAALDRARPDLSADARRWATLLDDGETRYDRPFASRLNNDGSPLQVCLTARSGRRAVHLVLDPGSDAFDAQEHHARGVCALERAAARQLSATARDGVLRLIAETLPLDVRAVPALSVGTLWLGMPLLGGGLAVYVNGAWGEEHEQWERIDGWLEAAGVSRRARAPSLRALRGRARVASIGMDIAPDGACRLKVYFRLRVAAPLGTLGDPLWTHDALVRFLTLGVGERPISAQGLVFCLAFEHAAAHPVDVKVDICGHCLAPRADVDEVLRRTANAPGVQVPQLRPWRGRPDVEVAFIGMGASADGTIRCNVYLKGRR
jgi:hypothetical protein